MLSTIVVSAITGALAGYLTTYARIRYEIKRNARTKQDAS